MTASDPDAVGPAAEEVRRRLLDEIRTGALRAGSRLGAERDLAATFGVSRSTVRQALASLERAGIVRRVPGRGGGTFVARGKIERDLTSVVGVPALLRRQGVSAGTRVISTSLVPPVEPVARALELGPNDLVADIVRIRLADGRPISLERVSLPESRFPGILDRPLSGSLYELLEGEYGTVAGEAVERIEVVAATPDESVILDASVGDPLLAITRRTTDAHGVPFEYSYDLFRADRTTVTVRTPGRASTGASVRVAGRVVELRGKRVVG